MFKFFKDTRQMLVDFYKLKDNVSKLTQENIELRRELETLELRSCIGLSQANNMRLHLMQEASKRGYFNTDNIISYNNSKEAWVRHCPSNILTNYMYWEDSQSLRIPVIGFGDHIMVGSITIYEKGKWAEIKNKSNL